MFQYAIGRAVAIRVGLPLVLDLSMLRVRSEAQPTRHYELGCFRLSEQRLRDRPLWWAQAWRELAARKWAGNSSLRLVEERGLFQPEVLQVNGPCQLDGYWQSESYFAPIASRLRAEFTILPQPDPRSAACAARMRDVPSVGLHVRRGDYVTNPNCAAFHSVCPKEYYDAAVELILSWLGPAAELFVFSDDIEWTRRHITYPLPTTYVDWNADRNYEDLRLMSACRALIMANSTFSWWGGWLNPQSDKLVIAPREWFKAPGFVSDLPNSPWLIAL
jgi:hypothetical protein